jgi:hypothetical protein
MVRKVVLETLFSFSVFIEYGNIVQTEWKKTYTHTHQLNLELLL